MNADRTPLLPIVLAVLGVSALPAWAEPAIYVPLGSAASVMVLDPMTDQPRFTIRNLPEVHGLAVSPDGKTLLAGSLMADQPGTVPKKPAGMSEDEHAAHHGGGAQPASGKASQLTLMRASDGEVLRRIPVPGVVHHVVISPDGRTAAASHPGGGGISLVDLEAKTVTASVPTGAQPNYMAFTPGGERLYVSNAGDGSISELAFGHGIATRKLKVGGAPEHLALSPDGERLYVNDVDAGAVLEIDLKGWKVARRFEVGGLLHGVDLSADGGTVFAAARGRNAIAVIDLSSGAISQVPLAPEPYHLTVARESGKIYVTSAAAPKIWAIDAASLAVEAEIPIEGEGHQIAVSQ